MFELGIAFGEGAVAGSHIGSYFGPVTCGAGLCIGGIMSIGAMYLYNGSYRTSYHLIFDTDKLDNLSKNKTKPKQEKKGESTPEEIEKEKTEAQAPGKPTADDGFEEKKNWDGKKVKSPKGKGYGWPDKKGNVWVPTGPNGHGGPHWDVQKPNGDYDNILPGGSIRGAKCK